MARRKKTEEALETLRGRVASMISAYVDYADSPGGGLDSAFEELDAWWPAAPLRAEIVDNEFIRQARALPESVRESSAYFRK